MPQIERKIVNKKPYFYLSEQIKIGKKYRKIQVYLGKSRPKSLEVHYEELEKKEIELIHNNILPLFKTEKIFNETELKKIEELRIKWKYNEIKSSQFKKDIYWIRFAVHFIFESNAIEGSRLSEKEVKNIVKKLRIKKSIDRKEVQEVKNSIKVFKYLHEGDFKLNQRSIISLHKELTKNLGINNGYKKTEIVVNNKNTCQPGKVRTRMAELLLWFRAQKKSKRHPLAVFAEFHQRFERIHPFEDGNGRIGRLLFNWMLMQSSYPPILFKKSRYKAYFNALDQADEGRKDKWYRFVIKVYKKAFWVDPKG